MLTPEQEKWIAHLRDDDEIVIKPYDRSASEKFDKVRRKIEKVLGKKVKVEHCGATGLGISGQDEIDVYIPTALKKFNGLLPLLKVLFGEPRSLYPGERARFVTTEDGKHIDVFLINKDSDGWKNGVKFEKYLKTHPEALGEYERLKEAGNGLSTREYYRRKINFINDILGKS